MLIAAVPTVACAGGGELPHAARGNVNQRHPEMIVRCRRTPVDRPVQRILHCATDRVICQPDGLRPAIGATRWRPSGFRILVIRFASRGGFVPTSAPSRRSSEAKGTWLRTSSVLTRCAAGIGELARVRIPPSSCRHAARGCVGRIAPIGVCRCSCLLWFAQPCTRRRLCRYSRVCLVVLSHVPTAAGGVTLSIRSAIVRGP
jgi:hypothetical protein